MATFTFSESATINAAPSKVYGILSDYKVGHPAILPKQFFKNLTVEAGGVGAGTVISVEMEAYGNKNTLKMTVDEPQPGVVLRESTLDGAVVTTFTFEPLDGGTRTRLTLHTVQVAASGFRGLIERLVTPLVGRRIYRQELALINEYAARA